MGLQESVKKLLPFAQAIVNGEIVQWKSARGNFVDVVELNDLFCSHEGGPDTVDETLRIKPPDSPYRPYTRDECVEHCLGKVIVNNDWKSVMLVTAVTDETAYNGMDMSGRTFEWLLAKCTHLDGSPCGMKIEEEPDARSY